MKHLPLDESITGIRLNSNMTFRRAAKDKVLKEDKKEAVLVEMHCCHHWKNGNSVNFWTREKNPNRENQSQDIYLNLRHICSFKKATFESWTEGNTGGEMATPSWAMRGHRVRAPVCPAGGRSHLLIVSPLTAFPSLNQLLLLQNRFNNTCQLLKCLGFVLRVISLTDVSRTTYQLLLTSWQWRACYRFSEMIHSKGRNDLVKQGWAAFKPKRSR